jgi:flagellar protein FlaF
MAVSEIIGAAVGVILLVIVAYVVVGGTLFAAETMANTQKDLTVQQEARIRTAFVITDQYNATTDSYIIYANITNTGTEIISDFKHMDVIVYDKQQGDYQVCIYDPDDITRGHWKFIPPINEFIHPNELDPGERYQVQIRSIGDSPRWFQITTANGVYASAFL